MQSRLVISKINDNCLNLHLFLIFIKLFFLLCSLGNLGQLTPNGGLHEFLQENHKKHGPMFSFFWGKELAVSVASPVIWKDIQTLFDRPGI